MTAKINLEHGNRFPYDASDKWWNDTDKTPPPGDDWSYKAARGVIADLQDRRSIKHGFDDIDEDIRAQIVSTLAEIIRLALVS